MLPMNINDMKWPPGATFETPEPGLMLVFREEPVCISYSIRHRATELEHQQMLWLKPRRCLMATVRFNPETGDVIYYAP